MILRYSIIVARRRTLNTLEKKSKNYETTRLHSSTLAKNFANDSEPSWRVSSTKSSANLTQERLAQNEKNLT